MQHVAMITYNNADYACPILATARFPNILPAIGGFKRLFSTVQKPNGLYTHLFSTALLE